MAADTGTVFSIGHSNHAYGGFLGLLRDAHITAVADVRTHPHSRHTPQFNRGTLEARLRADGIAYVFLGEDLGGRPGDSRYYRDGIADYERMAASPQMQRGLDRVIEGARKFRIALMCAERDPLDCHRCLLVGRALAERGVRVVHILADGATVSQAEVEERLLGLAGRAGADLFASRGERVAAAYRERARKVAYAEAAPQPPGPANPARGDRDPQA